MTAKSIIILHANLACDLAWIIRLIALLMRVLGKTFHKRWPGFLITVARRHHHGIFKLTFTFEEIQMSIRYSLCRNCEWENMVVV